MIINKIYKIVCLICIFMLFCNLCFATSYDVNSVINYSSVATESVLSTSSNVATISTVSSTDSKSDIKFSVDVDLNVDNNIDVNNNVSNSTTISGKSTLEGLKEISGHTEEEIYNEIVSDEALGNVLSDLMNELRPYLKDVIDIDVNINGYYVFSSKEALSLIVKHPIKFLMAIYNYTIQSMKEIFNIAEENSTIITE